MEDSTKNILLGCGICFAVGILLCVIAGVLGVKNQAIGQWNRLGKGTFTHALQSDNVSIEWDMFGENVIREQVEKLNVTNGAKVDSLELELGNGEAQIKASENDDIFVSTNGIGKLGYELSDGKLRIASAGKNSGKRMVTIYLPAYEMEKVEVELGAGELEADTVLMAEKVVMQLGAGEATVQGIKAEKADIQVGAGEADIKELDADELSVEAAAGSVNVTGLVREKGKAEVAAGEIVLKLSGDKDDYTCNAAAGLGTISVGGQTISGLAAEQKFGNGEKTLDLECAMGNISVQFEE